MQDQKTLSPPAWFELALLGLIWGGSFLAVRVILDEVQVVTSVLHRTGWAALVLWFYVALRRLPLPRDPGIWGAFVVMGLLNNVIPFGLMAWGQLSIESGLTSILNAATAIFGVLVAALFFADERLSARKVIGVTLGFAGVAMAVGLSSLATFDLRSTAQLAVLGGAFSYALASAWARLHLGGVTPEVAAAGMLGASTLFLMPAVWLVDGGISFDLSLRVWAAIAYLSLFATAGAYLLYYRVLAQAGSGNLMLVTLVIPPVAIVLGALVLGESLPARAFGGFVLLALGLLVLNTNRRSRD
jgi:drug/metabolite transporter (DMT)-like permease